MNIFILMYNLGIKLQLIDEQTWQGHMGNIGNDKLWKYNMWINYLENEINTEILIKGLTCIIANIIVPQWKDEKNNWY